MIQQNARFATIVVAVIVVALFGFSMYILLTREDTIIVVNEAAQEPKQEMFRAGLETPQDTPAPEQPMVVSNPTLRILATGVGFLNVRDGSSLQAKKVGQVRPGEEYEYSDTQNNWYRIVHPELPEAWVSGQYVEVVR